jgi:hypothetical protein
MSPRGSLKGEPGSAQPEATLGFSHSARCVNYRSHEDTAFFR